MIRTPREHFEELDWLSLAQGECDPALRAELERHRAECRDCSRLYSSCLRMSDALPHALAALVGDGELSDSAEHGSRSDAPAGDAAVISLARAEADRRVRAEDRVREELERMLGPGSTEGSELRGDPGIAHLLEAGNLIRDLFRSDGVKANRVLDWAIAALPAAKEREPDDPRADLAEGRLVTLKAYARTVPGQGKEALDFLERARPLLAGSDATAQDLAAWHRYRALAMRLLSRHDEALADLAETERFLRLAGDENRLARCRLSQAVSISEAGDPARAVGIYEELLANRAVADDRALLSFVYQNLGADLVDLREFERARAAIARAIELFRATRQEDRLVACRSSLARLAILEGRHAEALRICKALRSDLRARGLIWHEVENELRFAEIYLETGRPEIAVSVCRSVIPRISEMEFGAEAVRAASYLARAESELDVSHVRQVQRFLRRLDADPNAAWSAA